MLNYIQGHLVEILALFASLMHVLGAISAAHALMANRTSQGAIAWAMCLLTFPYLGVPLYWIFGRDKFSGYVDSRRAGDLEMHHITESLTDAGESYRAYPKGTEGPHTVLEALACLPFTCDNDLKLLIDGDATFGAIFEAMSTAKAYILVQFFIIHDDELGRELQRRMIDKAREGIRVYCVYDEVGSSSLPRRYVSELREAGVDIRPFNTRKGLWNRFQVNFRNHRKIVVVDGEIAFVGGHNVGDEYMGRDPKFGHWRDTHVQVEGPAVVELQLVFMEDWYWASHELPEMTWTAGRVRQGGQTALVIPTGPADKLDTCSLFFTHAIHAAKERFWLVSPYFVPDAEVVSALQLAALRGVDVRIMLPLEPDHLMVYLASFSYLSQLDMPGIRFFRYEPGFLHQKTMLVDDNWACVGTANADNRSFRLNFEVSLVSTDPTFCGDVQAMLAKDFGACRTVAADDYRRLKLATKLGVKISRLLSPIL